MKAEVLTITPAQAALYLEGNTSNRPLLRTHVAFLAQQMRDGQWKENGEAIKFNGSRLLDGQHRLAACVKANTPFRTLVILGIEDTVFDTLDTGKVRTANDVLAMSGIINTRMVSTAIRCIHMIRNGGKTTENGGNRLLTNAEVLLWAQGNTSIQDSATIVIAHKHARKLIGSGAAVALHFLFSKKDSALCNQFFKSMEDGIGMLANDPVYLLREKLNDNMLSREKFSSVTILAYCIKAWNARRANEPMKRLAWHTGRGEAFPVIS